MALHRFPFVGIEAARLVEDAVADSQLADVVQQRGAVQPATAGSGHVELRGDRVGVARHALTVPVGEVALGVDDVGERLSDRVETGLIDEHGTRVGLERHHPLLESLRAQARPERPAARDREKRPADLRVEPGARAAAHFGFDGAFAADGVEDIDDLSEQRYACADRDVFPAQALRPTLAVPMLIQAEDSRADRFAEPEPAHDLRASLASRMDQLGGERIAIAVQVHQPLDARAQRFAGSGVAQHEAGQLQQALRVDLLEVVLGAQLIAAVQLPEARGVAAAAGVLQQQRVVEIGKRQGIQSEHPPGVHADPAAAQAVSGRLALGEVEGVAQRSDDLREAYRRADARRLRYQPVGDSGAICGCIHGISCRRLRGRSRRVIGMRASPEAHGACMTLAFTKIGGRFSCRRSRFGMLGGRAQNPRSDVDVLLVLSLLRLPL